MSDYLVLHSASSLMFEGTVRCCTVSVLINQLNVCVKFLEFYPATLFGQTPTLRDCLCVPSSGSMWSRGWYRQKSQTRELLQRITESVKWFKENWEIYQHQIIFERRRRVKRKRRGSFWKAVGVINICENWVCLILSTQNVLSALL